METVFVGSYLPLNGLLGMLVTNAIVKTIIIIITVLFLQWYKVTNATNLLSSFHNRSGIFLSSVNLSTLPKFIVLFFFFLFYPSL